MTAIEPSGNSGRGGLGYKLPYIGIDRYGFSLSSPFIPMWEEEEAYIRPSPHPTPHPSRLLCRHRSPVWHPNFSARGRSTVFALSPSLRDCRGKTAIKAQPSLPPEILKSFFIPRWIDKSFFFFFRGNGRSDKLHFRNAVVMVFNTFYSYWCYFVE